MFKIYGKRFSFTLVEVIVVCSMIAVMVIWIIFAINRAFVFMDNTRLAVRATNLAREWVEMVYNIRDTNRRKHSWEKDKYRLLTDPANATDSAFYFWWLPNYGEGKYFVIGEKTSLTGDTFVYATSVYVPNENGDEFYTLDWFFSEAYDGIRNKFKLDFTWTYSYYSGSVIGTWNMEDLLGWSGITFYRVLRIYGVYKKNTDNPNNACSDKATCLTNWTPAELRFCVKVFYENKWYHASELCSIMTNFME